MWQLVRGRGVHMLNSLVIRSNFLGGLLTKELSERYFGISKKQRHAYFHLEAYTEHTFMNLSTQP